MKNYITIISFKTNELKVTHTYNTNYITIEKVKGPFVQKIKVGTTEEAQEYVHNLARMFGAEIGLQITEVISNPYDQNISFFKLSK